MIDYNLLVVLRMLDFLRQSHIVYTKLYRSDVTASRHRFYYVIIYTYLIAMD